MESRNLNHNKARLVVLTVFVIGIAVGALSMNLYQRLTNSNPENQPPPRVVILKNLTDRLHLTEAQQMQIREILDGTFENYRAIRTDMDNEPKLKEFDHRFNEARQQGREKMRQVLTSEQMPEFEKILQEYDQKRQEMREKRKK